MKRNEGKLAHLQNSPTAATVGNQLYGSSGVMPYRVIVQAAGGSFQAVEVDAATGDEAAVKALAQFMGGKVTYVGPAPQTATLEGADAA